MNSDENEKKSFKKSNGTEFTEDQLKQIKTLMEIQQL